MPYTDFTDVIQDDADAIRYIDGSTSSIVFADMPNRILGINGLKFGPTDSVDSWVGKFLPYVTGSEYITDMSFWFWHGKISGTPDFSNFSTASATNMSHMFQGSNATILDLSSFDTSNVTDMSSMFSGMGSVRTINLSSFDTSNVTKMNNMFSTCFVSSIDISNFDVSNVTTMQFMFAEGEYDPALNNNMYNSLDFSNWNTSSLTDVAGMFYGYKLYRVDLDLSSFDTSNITAMTSMFETVGQIRATWTVDFSNWNTSNVTSMHRMFYGFNGIIWLPSTFVGTAITNPNYKPFHEPQASGLSVEVYTDAIDAETQDWGIIDSGFVIHYNSTYQDFLNAISQ